MGNCTLTAASVLLGSHIGIHYYRRVWYEQHDFAVPYPALGLSYSALLDNLELGAMAW